ncbi:hypothetical protein ScPMuIL_003542 [Solemya velum]
MNASLPTQYEYNQVHDWMSKIQRPTPYRVGNARFHIKPRSIMYTFIFLAAIVVLIVYFLPNRTRRICFQEKEYISDTYPLTVPVLSPEGMTYQIALVADLDTDSRSPLTAYTWISHLLLGNLTISSDHRHVKIVFNKDTITLTSTLSQAGRGMELSDLVVFNGKLYTIDDRTGVIYQIKNNKTLPWVLLTDGDGNTSKGFKCEWATVKQGRLYVGGLGKEWTTNDGIIVNLNPQWVKSIGPKGDVIHLDWQKNYNALRHKTRTSYPGYMIHESAMWSEIHQKWFFLPRRVSHQQYEEVADERRAANMLLSTDDNFEKIDIRFVGDVNPTHGFSSFKFIPGTNDEIIVAIKSEENRGKIASYIMVFTIYGDIILSEKKISELKYEGIEFI